MSYFELADITKCIELYMPTPRSNLMKCFIIVLLVALISPFIINCFFAYPQTDDFVYTCISRNMGFFKSQYNWYQSWTGRFTSTALLSINPLVYNSLAGYKLVFAILILAQLAAIYLLTYSLTRKTLSRQDTLIFAMTLLFAFLDKMDDIRSGLYWMAGVVTYQLAETLLLLFLAMTLGIHHGMRHNNLLNRWAIITIAVLLGGTNEIVLALVTFTTALFTCYSFAKKLINISQIETFVSVSIGGCLGFFAPGNFARLHEYSGRRNILTTSTSALNSALTSMEVWITYPTTLILMSMVFTAITNKPQLSVIFSKLNILISLCLLLLLTFTCFFIPYWSTGMPPQNRVINMIYLFFLTGWMINLAIIFSHFGEPIVHLLKKVPVNLGCFIATSFILFLFSIGTSNFVLVTNDLLSGNSFHYNAEMLQRQAKLLSSDKDTMELENITHTPRSLFFAFIGRDSKYWVNHYYASYFGKKAVTSTENN